MCKARCGSTSFRPRAGPLACTLGEHSSAPPPAHRGAKRHLCAGARTAPDRSPASAWHGTLGAPFDPSAEH
eukprot:CAMPEP_0171194934 /NCGR_PEP_ID=MMETSP0790-20130122/21142_1 /TAXON_ID=2925 /ORGANISM="Alexandrium catenella, Strain OF101" /LENGTH=70 /DNA_ID=CAMNT_0011660141 /DNA_START=44 /DNA_END=253 /DNA_ORIENTATION=+